MEIKLKMVFRKFNKERCAAFCLDSCFYKLFNTDPAF